MMRNNILPFFILSHTLSVTGGRNAASESGCHHLPQSLSLSISLIVHSSHNVVALHLDCIPCVALCRASLLVTVGAAPLQQEFSIFFVLIAEPFVLNPKT